MLWLSKLFHAVATGSAERRRRLTPVGLIFFFGLLAALVLVALFTDRLLSLPPLLPGVVGLTFGFILLATGVVLWIWCATLFRKAQGTPVPFNPPRELVIIGPYAIVRNPMMTAVFVGLFGLAITIHSMSLALLWTPLFVILDVIELKFVEEPELERRLGAAYIAYKERVPMFLPRILGK
jgi:protein-S-isoprenylcysteine O-methyltransferase Ste14